MSKKTREAWTPIKNYTFPSSKADSIAKLVGSKYTDFESVIQDLQKQSLGNFYPSKRKLIVTIISDFYHDDKDVPLKNVERKIKDLAEFQEMYELNIIKIPLVSSEDESQSEKLIKLFNKHFRHIPQRKERLLNHFTLTDSEFMINLESVIFPTYPIRNRNIDFYFTNISSDLYSIVDLPDTFKNKELVLKIKADNIDELEKTTTQYAILNSEGGRVTSKGYPKLFSYEDVNIIPENHLSEKCHIEFILKNASREGYSNVGIEFFAHKANEKYLIPITLSERLSTTTARVILMSAWAMIISLGVLGHLGFFLIFVHVFLSARLTSSNNTRAQIPSSL